MASTIHPGELSGAHEAGFEVVSQNPRSSEGFSLPDLSDPAQLEPGGIPFETFEGKASIARASVSWRFRVPKEFTRDASVIIDHGLGAKQGAYSELSDYLASHGIATADYRATHFQSWLAGLHPKHLLNASRLLYQAPWGVIREIQAQDDIKAPTKTFDMVGHSLGGRTAVKNAEQHPNAIDNVIAIDSIGLEDHHLPGLASRLPGFFGKDVGSLLTGSELSLEEKARLLANGVLYFSENPWRGAGEIWSLSRSRIGDEMADLSAQGKGTAIIVSPEDSLISPKKTKEKSSGKPDVFVELPDIPDKRLDHLGPIRHPEVYGRTLISVLGYLDSIKATQDSQLQTAA